MSDLLVLQLPSGDRSTERAAHSVALGISGSLSNTWRAMDWSAKDQWLVARFNDHGGLDHGEQDHRIKARHVPLEGLLQDYELLTDTALEFDSSSLKVRTPLVTWRTLWLAQSSNRVALSTSLKLCAFVLGGFEPDQRTVTQFLATGSLGPTLSWDRRVRQLPPAATVEIAGDRSEAFVRSDSDLSPSPDEVSDRTARRELQRRISSVLRAKLDGRSGWVLPLSGGYDSRALLLMGPRSIRTVTWGTANSLEDPLSDSMVAARLAESIPDRPSGLHQFLELYGRAAEPALVLRRFVVASEGRTDQLSAYQDGLAMWQLLADQGVAGILRGDEVFGGYKRRTARGVRREAGALGPTDIVPSVGVSKIGDLSLLYEPPAKSGMTHETWRDAVYRGFRVPSVLSALTQVKAAYVDVVCPFLHPDVVSYSTGLADRQRSDKRVFSDLVEELSPPVPFALRSALPRRPFEVSTSVSEFMTTKLQEEPKVCSPQLVRHLVDAVGSESAQADARNGIASGRRVRHRIRALVPERIVRDVARLERETRVRLSDDRLRLRAYIAEETAGLLELWGAAGKRALTQSQS